MKVVFELFCESLLDRRLCDNSGRSYGCLHRVYMTTHAHTGLPKKLEALAKMRGGELVGKYQRSIINYMYRCIASIPEGNSELVKAKWLSL